MNTTENVVNRELSTCATRWRSVLGQGKPLFVLHLFQLVVAASSTKLRLPRQNTRRNIPSNVNRKPRAASQSKSLSAHCQLRKRIRNASQTCCGADSFSGHHDGFANLTPSAKRHKDKFSEASLFLLLHITICRAPFRIHLTMIQKLNSIILFIKRVENPVMVIPRGWFCSSGCTTSWQWSDGNPCGWH